MTLKLTTVRRYGLGLVLFSAPTQRASVRTAPIDRDAAATVAIGASGTQQADTLSRELEQRVRGGAQLDGYATDDWLRVQRMYTASGYRAMWFDTTGGIFRLRPKAVALIGALSTASAHALPLDTYPNSALLTALDALTDRVAVSAVSAARADVALTASFVALATDLLIGQINPRTVNRAWHIDPQNIDVDSVLNSAMNHESFSDAIAALQPQDPDYVTLMQLARYRQLVSTGG